MATLKQTTQFKINKLNITLRNGQTFPLGGSFRELNLFENIFLPCRSGNIVIEDSAGIYERMNIKGGEKIFIDIDKAEGGPKAMNYKKEFVVYKTTNRQNISPTAQIFVLHFVNEDFIFSEQKKLSQSYSGLYSGLVSKILKDQLNVNIAPPKNGKSGVNQIYPTDKIQDVIVPNLSPFESIQWISKRSTSSQYKVPDFLFYENANGYNFVPVSKLWSDGVKWKINVVPKNIDDNLGTEFLGARDMKILSQYDMGKGIQDGVYGGKFGGIDTLTKTIVINKVADADTNSQNSGNDKQNMTSAKTKDGKDYRDMNDARIVYHPFTLPRVVSPYINQNSPRTAAVTDETHKYIFQRKQYFTNLLQRRIQLVMNGNFGLSCGYVINLTVPHFAQADANQTSSDNTLSGKYIITGARHIIRPNMHETIIELSTDTSKK